ncbi:site-specific DNA-methyltransferase [Salinisphaera hydrothermalis]|uniref:DNA methylase N-4/N-6 domain-containing protein n=1 Tax=Salinisphaera hydrothermalis (strain C41B8) TaxID=1304275 RepID=A0A084IIR8_SALHC|nr:DNA methyltransferase [Salinisphaera hydrothermalis]KEZ76602.1 DNA methylase N-4/N-6 domain-containing protein [Salinisphaera hydrothermalis C41B8]
MSQNPAFDKLIRLLKELFQLDQPDLDFGLYRIMHARAGEISQFLDRDLLPQVKDAFSRYRTADKAELEKELQQAIEQANGLGVDPETTGKVKELRQKIAEQGVDVTGLEQEVYDHLYKFFRRYYHEGDFLAKRVYKPGVYAIPYEGEEVKLHWANKDQYYIKTSEYLRDYAFTLKPGADDPKRVHFRLVDSAEGDHDNVKEAEGNNRVFILAGEDFIAEEKGESGKELMIRFEYRPATVDDWSEDAKASATAAGKKKPPTQKDLRADAARRVLEVEDDGLNPWLAELAQNHIKADGEAADYSRLAAHLNRYTARNTFDYFIHKDLGGFLRRELDFYIKNEVMHLDDIESETVPRVEQYLSKIKVIRQIAGKIIEFLAQLEDFQKKLWLKRKFVTETSYCIRIGCIPEAFYPEIAANDAQRQEWTELHAIHEMEADLTTVAYSEPLTVEFLKAYPTLMVDTRYFENEFCQRLLEGISNINERTDGILFNGENFQALSLMSCGLREGIKCIFTDPPYNTGSDGFPYKDAYQHSSWLTMMDNRLGVGTRLLSSDGIFASNIDDNEIDSLKSLVSEQLGKDNEIGNLVWKGSTDNNPTRIAVEHEYVVFHAKSKNYVDKHWSAADNETKQFILDEFEQIKNSSSSLEEIEQKFLTFMSENKENIGDLYRYRRVDEDGPYVARRNMENPGKKGYDYDVPHPTTKKPCAKPYWGWRFPETTMDKYREEGRLIFGETEEKIPELKVYLRDVGFPLRSVFYLDARKGSNDLDRLFGARNVFKNPKPVELASYLLPYVTSQKSSVLDFFAGSGTTGHALIHLNREDGGDRKFFLVEMGEHFDDVLVPRLKKVAFTSKWKAGKPERLATPEESERSPRIMKVVRLESYEDALNNLDLRRSETQDDLLNSHSTQGVDGLREQYLLRYWLDVETRGSQSVLNIGAFTDPTAYKLKVKRPGSEETREVNVDLLETFNWLIGLTVETMAAPQTVCAQFKRDDDPDLPEENPRRLLLDGRIREAEDGPWWFRTVTGTTPDGRKTLVIWRKLTGEPEQDNLVLDEWFKKQGYSSKDSEFDLIYVNGDNNLENLRQPDDTWKVRLIEEDFHRLMFEEAEA